MLKTIKVQIIRVIYQPYDEKKKIYLGHFDQ